MKAMVLAAGVGSRLRPLTCQLSKPMVPIVNKPVVEHVLNLLKKYNITEVMLNLHYFPESIREYFGDGSKFGLKLSYSYEEKLLGTAGGLKKVENFFNETFAVLSGDGLSDIDLEKAIEFHKSKKALATIILKEVDFPLEYGVVIFNKDGRITRFLEKPSWGEIFSNTANTGIYIFEPEIFNEIPYGLEYDFGSTLFPKLLAENKPLYGYVSNDFWCDIGDFPEYRQTHYSILQKQVKIAIPGKEVAQDVWVGKGTIINSKAKITGPVVIGENCVIEDDVEISEFTTIGNNNTICKGTSIKRGIMLDNNYISENNQLRGCIIGKNCFFESNVTIFESAVIADGCTIGSGAIIKPNVRVWPNKIIETGVTLSTSLIWGEKWRKNLFSADGVFGKANVEITPEFAAKLGEAFGTCLGKNSSVVISTYNDKMGKMLKRVMEGGLIATGINIYDADNSPSFLNRFIINKKGISGGIYIKKSVSDPNSICIEFYNSQGMNVGRDLEKKIEKIFYREEFVRVVPTDFGKITIISDLENEYLEELNVFFEKENIKLSDIKIALQYEKSKFPLTKISIENILENIGCEVILVEKELDQKIINEKCNFGIRLFSEDEKIEILDDKGNVIDNNKALIFMTMMKLKNSSVGNIAVPVSTSRIVENLVQKFSRKLFWTKIQESDLMKTCVGNGVIFGGIGDGRYIYTKYRPYFDPIISIVRLLESVSDEKKKISELLKEIPEYYLEHDKIDCAWESKGKILQDIMDEYKDYNLELIDGIKINFNSSNWILILPDTEEPFLHLWAEAGSDKEVKEMISNYKVKILELIKK